MSAFNLQTLHDGETPFYSFQTDLEGDTFKFDFYWSSRRSRWSFDLTTVAGEQIITGQVVHPNLNLLRRSVSANRPPGVLVCLPENPNGTIEAPALTDLGTSYSLTYYTSDDPEVA